MPEAFLLSGPPTLLLLRFQTAEAKLGIPARLDSDACEGFWRWQRKNTGIWFQAEGKLPLHQGPPHLPRKGGVVVVGETPRREGL